MVGLSKLGAWFLLMIISYALVAWMNRPLAALASKKMTG